MKRTSIACAAIMLATIGANELAAQCAGVNTCTTTHTVSVTVGGLISLGMSTTTTALTNPTSDNIRDGALLVDAGPTLTVSANESWTLNIKSLNSSVWTYNGPASGVKPIAQLAWSTSSGGTFTPITNTDAVFLAGTGASSSTQSSSFFQTTWTPGFGAPSNAPGLYSLPVAFTLTAP